MPICPRCKVEMTKFKVKLNGYTTAEIVDGKLTIDYSKVKPRFFCDNNNCRHKVQLFSNWQKAERFLLDIPEPEKRKTTSRW